MAHIKEYILLLIRMLLVAPFVVNGSARSYHDILKTLENPNKLLFDVTDLVNIEAEEGSEAFLQFGNVDTSGIRLSPIIYYTREMSLNHNSDVDHNHTHSSNAITALKIDYTALDPFHKFSLLANKTIVSFMYMMNDGDGKSTNLSFPLTTEKTKEILRNSLIAGDEHLAVIFHYNICDRSKLGCVDKLREMYSIIMEFKETWRSVKIGILYNYEENVLGEDDLEFTKIISVVDVAVMEYGIPVAEFALTYPRFKSLLKRKLSANKEYALKTNPDCKMFTKLAIFDGKYSFLNVPLMRLYSSYYFYLLQYTTNWINERNEGSIILESFQNFMAKKTGLDGADIREVVIPELDSENDWMSTSDFGSCEMKVMLNQVASQFRVLPVDGDALSRQLENMNRCVFNNRTDCTANETESVICDRPSTNGSLPYLNIDYFVYPSISSFAISKMKTDLGEFGIPWRQLEIYTTDTFQNTDNLLRIPLGKETLTDLLNDNVTIVCGSGTQIMDSNEKYSLQFILNDAYAKCSQMWNSSNIISLDLHLDVLDDMSYPNNLVRLSLRLWPTAIVYQTFSRKYPGKRAVINIKLEGTCNLEEEGQGCDYFSNLFCNHEIHKYNEMVEYIINFARIQKLSIRLKPVLDKSNKIGWWSPIKVSSRINMTATKFPVFVARSYPEKHMMGNFQTDPCIIPTSKVSFKGIGIDKDYAGVTIHIGKLRKTPISIEELRVLLQFTFHRFSQVEIVLGGASDLDAVIQLLSQGDLMSKLQLEGRPDVNLYVGLNWKFINEREGGVKRLINEVSELKLKPAGFHLLNWENASDAVLQSFLNELMQNKFKVGLGSEECVAEVNRRFWNVRRFNMSSYLDYFLCNVENVFVNVSASTKSYAVEMEKYLDTQLYIKKYFEKMFPFKSIDVLFRRDHSEKGCQKRIVTRHVAHERLRFVSDVSRYASAYKMKTFIMSAFEITNRACGWWRVLNSDNLANTTVFKENEAEYWGRKTWRPVFSAWDVLPSTIPEVQLQSTQ